MTRRTWTHRRLGIDRGRVSAEALASSDRFLDDLAGRLERRVEAGSTTAVADPLYVALLEHVRDIDLTVELIELDPQPSLTLAPPAVRPRRRVLAAAAMAGVAVIAVAAIAVADRSGRPATTSPQLAAAAQSHQLLRQASGLLTAAGSADAAHRAALLRQVRADLHHVTELLPLTSRSDQPGIREQLEADDNAADRAEHHGGPDGREDGPGRSGRGDHGGRGKHSGRGAGTGHGDGRDGGKHGDDGPGDGRHGGDGQSGKSDGGGSGSGTSGSGTSSTAGAGTSGSGKSGSGKSGSGSSTSGSSGSSGGGSSSGSGKGDDGGSGSSGSGDGGSGSSGSGSGSGKGDDGGPGSDGSGNGGGSED